MKPQRGLPLNDVCFSWSANCLKLRKATHGTGVWQVMRARGGPSGGCEGAARIRTSVCTGQGGGCSAARGGSGAPAGPGGVPPRSNARLRPDARALPTGLAPDSAPADPYSALFIVETKTVSPCL